MERNFDNKRAFKYNDEYTSLVSRTCKCGHVVNIYNRFGREICSYCGRNVFLTKKHEFKYQMQRRCHNATSTKIMG